MPSICFIVEFNIVQKVKKKIVCFNTDNKIIFLYRFGSHFDVKALLLFNST